jgi:hypothetical protein
MKSRELLREWLKFYYEHELQILIGLFIILFIVFYVVGLFLLNRSVWERNQELLGVISSGFTNWSEVGSWNGS